jgi:hypothetical protein
VTDLPPYRRDFGGVKFTLTGEEPKMSAEIIATLGGTLSYTPGNHRYMWNNQKVDLSVSAVCNSFATPFGAASGWAAKVIREELLRSVDDEPLDREAYSDWAKTLCSAPRRVSKLAADVGTAVHQFIEDKSNDLRPEYSQDDEVARCQRGVAAWYDQNVDQVLSSERRIYSLKWKIAGTVDMVAKMKNGRNGRTAVIDWKGVTDLDASVKAAHIGQLTAYREMLTESGEKIDDCILVRFSRKTGEVDALVLQDHQANIEAFEAALHLARYKPQTENF